MRMPILETPRLQIRPFVIGDLDIVHALLCAAFEDTTTTRAERDAWLRWAIANEEQLAQLHQPPYGDRALVLRASGELIGAVGLVPSFSLFERLPYFQAQAAQPTPQFCTPEVGLFYALSAAHLRHGYASEAARALVDYAFGVLRVKRIVATTTHDNAASIGVMRMPSLRIEANTQPEPPWLQVVGVLANTA